MNAPVVIHVDSLMKVKEVQVVVEDGVEVHPELINHHIVNHLHQVYAMLFKRENVNVDLHVDTLMVVRLLIRLNRLFICLRNNNRLFICLKNN